MDVADDHLRGRVRVVVFDDEVERAEDRRVRLALNLAVNRDAIIKKIFNGYALANRRSHAWR